MILVRNTVRRLAGQDPIEPCGAIMPHVSHTYPAYGPNGSKRYLHCEGVQ